MSNNFHELKLSHSMSPSLLFMLLTSLNFIYRIAFISNWLDSRHHIKNNHMLSLVSTDHLVALTDINCKAINPAIGVEPSESEVKLSAVRSSQVVIIE